MEAPKYAREQMNTAERWIKKRKQAVNKTRPSRHWFQSEEVRLWLSVLAYDMGNL